VPHETLSYDVLHHKGAVHVSYFDEPADF